MKKKKIILRMLIVSLLIVSFHLYIGGSSVSAARTPYLHSAKSVEELLEWLKDERQDPSPTRFRIARQYDTILTVKAKENGYLLDEITVHPDFGYMGYRFEKGDNRMNIGINLPDKAEPRQSFEETIKNQQDKYENLQYQKDTVQILGKELALYSLHEGYYTRKTDGESIWIQSQARFEINNAQVTILLLDGLEEWTNDYLDLFEFSYQVLPDVRIKGDVNQDGRITLSDAQKALRAALGMITLSGDDFWAADVEDRSKTSLSDAQIILRAALGIASIEELVFARQNPDDILFEVITDKEAYRLGDNVRITVRATNVSNRTINLFGFDPSQCFQFALKSNDESVVFWDSLDEGYTPAVHYRDTLDPGETKDLKATIYTSRPRDTGWNTSLIGTLPSGGYHLAASLCYTETPQSEDFIIKWYRYTYPITIAP